MKSLTEVLKAVLAGSSKHQQNQFDPAISLVDMHVPKDYDSSSDKQFKCPVMDKWMSLEDRLSKLNHSHTDQNHKSPRTEWAHSEGMGAVRSFI